MSRSSVPGTLGRRDRRSSALLKRMRHGQSPPLWPRMLIAPRWPRLRQFGGWFALGVLAFGGEVVLLALLYQHLRCPLWLASAVAAEAVLLARFMATDRLVFGHARPTLVRCGRFHGAGMGSFAVSWLVLNGAAALLGLPYVAAALLGSVAAFLWSALSNFLWVWRPAPQGPPRGLSSELPVSRNPTTTLE